jgi:hypothetical protein
VRTPDQLAEAIFPVLDHVSSRDVENFCKEAALFGHHAPTTATGMR